MTTGPTIAWRMAERIHRRDRADAARAEVRGEGTVGVLKGPTE
jgi:hypothetical protein